MRLILAFVCFCISSFLFAQEVDSLKEFNEFIATDVDLNNGHQFEPFYRSNIADELFPLAGVGSGAFPILYQPEHALDVALGYDQYRHYFITRDLLSWVQRDQPISAMELIIGSKAAQQAFSAYHHQNFGEQLNLGLKLKRFRSPGFYNNQQTRYNAFGGYLGVKSKTNSYLAQFRFSLNNVRIEANGGFTEDFFARDSVLLTNAFIETKLNDVDIRHKETMASLEQALIISQKLPDSTSINRWQFAAEHRFEYQFERDYFYDPNPDSSYYLHYFQNDDSVSNHLRLNQFKNRLGLRYLSKSKVGIGLNLAAGFEIDAFRLKQQYVIWNWYQLTAYQTANISIGRVQLDAETQQRLLGYQIGAFSNLASFTYRPGADIYLKAGIVQSSTEVDWIDHTYISRSEDYRFSLDKESKWSFNQSFYFKDWDFDLFANQHFIKGLVYYDHHVRQSQSVDWQSIFQFGASKGFAFGRFITNSSLIYQQMSDQTLFGLPVLYGRQRFIYKERAFKDALKLQLGFDLRISSSWRANGYFPLLNTRYQSDNLLKPNPDLDVFLNMKVKTVRLMFKGSNLLFSAFNRGYYYYDFYAADPTRFDFGFNWRFFE